MTAVASAVDAAAFGEYRRPVRTEPAFSGRLGSRPAAGRFHVYSARTSGASHRIELIRALAGLDDAVSLSHVHGLRDARGWAFREPTGPDPVNGFALLREAYEATDPGFAGQVRVPVLWDRQTGRIVSDDPVTIGVDLATRFGDSGLYPAALAAEIERVRAAIAAGFSRRLAAAVHDQAVAAEVRSVLQRLDGHFRTRSHLVGDELTDADLRLWVSAVRYDVGVNAHRSVGPALSTYPSLWRWALDLFARPAFRSTTDFGAFAAPLADTAAWTA